MLGDRAGRDSICHGDLQMQAQGPRWCRVLHFDDNSSRDLIRFVSARSTFSAVNEEPTDDSRYKLLGRRKSITSDVMVYLISYTAHLMFSST